MRLVATLGMSILITLLVGGCATPSKPGFDLSNDCRLRSMPWSQVSSAPSPGVGISIGSVFGGGRSSRSYDDDVSETRTRRGGGFGALSIDFGRLFATPSVDLVGQWLEDGPGFADSYSNSCMPMHGLVKGGWPLVVDYTADGSSITTLEVHVRGVTRPTVFNLDNARGRHLMQFRLPDHIGSAAHPAVFLLRSVRSVGGTHVAGYLQVHGLGAGHRAVGSVAIERVDFQPALLQRSAQQQAAFSFLSKSDFNRISVNVLRVDNIANEITVSLAREYQFTGGVSRGTVFGQQPPRRWDGTDAQNRASIGVHLLQVRAWMSVREDADWVTAWSENAVQVIE